MHAYPNINKFADGKSGQPGTLLSFHWYAVMGMPILQTLL